MRTLQLVIALLILVAVLVGSYYQGSRRGHLKGYDLGYQEAILDVEELPRNKNFFELTRPYDSVGVSAQKHEGQMYLIPSFGPALSVPDTSFAVFSDPTDTSSKRKILLPMQALDAIIFGYDDTQAYAKYGVIVDWHDERLDFTGFPDGITLSIPVGTTVEAEDGRQLSLDEVDISFGTPNEIVDFSQKSQR